MTSWNKEFILRKGPDRTKKETTNKCEWVKARAPYVPTLRLRSLPTSYRIANPPLPQNGPFKSLHMTPAWPAWDAVPDKWFPAVESYENLVLKSLIFTVGALTCQWPGLFMPTSICLPSCSCASLSPILCPPFSSFHLSRFEVLGPVSLPFNFPSMLGSQSALCFPLPGLLPFPSCLFIIQTQCN